MSEDNILPKYADVKKKIEMVSINSGIGKALGNSSLRETIILDLAKITGQKPIPRQAKKAIAGFKIRGGDTVGLSLTLRGKRMYDFLKKLRNIVLPGMRDFRGLHEKSLDRAGNFSLGIKESTAFPEIRSDDSRSVFGLQINIKTKAKTKEEGKTILESLGFPFEKGRKE